MPLVEQIFHDNYVNPHISSIRRAIADLEDAENLREDGRQLWILGVSISDPSTIFATLTPSEIALCMYSK